MQSQMVQFKEQLEIFAKKYKNDIKKDETFRQNFQSMCTSIGVDPLACNLFFFFFIFFFFFNLLPIIIYLFIVIT